MTKKHPVLLSHAVSQPANAKAKPITANAIIMTMKRKITAFRSIIVLSMPFVQVKPALDA